MEEFGFEPRRSAPKFLVSLRYHPGSSTGMPCFKSRVVKRTYTLFALGNILSWGQANMSLILWNLALETPRGPERVDSFACSTVSRSRVMVNIPLKLGSWELLAIYPLIHLLSVIWRYCSSWTVHIPRVKAIDIYISWTWRSVQKCTSYLWECLSHLLQMGGKEVPGTVPILS